MAAGVVSLSGTPTQNQILTASVTDVRRRTGGAPIAYQWQQSADNGLHLEQHQRRDVDGTLSLASRHRSASSCGSSASYTDLLGSSESAGEPRDCGGRPTSMISASSA